MNLLGYKKLSISDASTMYNFNTLTSHGFQANTISLIIVQT